jgi:hypothetical protein
VSRTPTATRQTLFGTGAPSECRSRRKDIRDLSGLILNVTPRSLRKVRDTGLSHFSSEPFPLQATLAHYRLLNGNHHPPLAVVVVQRPQLVSRQWMVADLMGLDRTTFWGDAVSEPQVGERCLHGEWRLGTDRESSCSSFVDGAVACQL